MPSKNPPKIYPVARAAPPDKYVPEKVPRRKGSMLASSLPSRVLNILHYPDGRKEKLT